MKKFITLLTLLILSYGNVSAQGDVALSQEDKDALTERINEKLDDFQDKLRIVAGSHEKSTKQAAVTTALKLFIGEGNRYLCVDENNVERWHKPVQVEKSSKVRGVVIQSLKSYLNALTLMSGYRYDKVTIDQADVVRIDNINNVGNGKYMAIATIMQHYYGSKDGKQILDDYITKTIKLYISESEYTTIRKEIETSNGKVVFLEPKLSDIKITETWH